MNFYYTGKKVISLITEGISSAKHVKLAGAVSLVVGMTMVGARMEAGTRERRQDQEKAGGLAYGKLPSSHDKELPGAL